VRETALVWDTALDDDPAVTDPEMVAPFATPEPLADDGAVGAVTPVLEPPQAAAMRDAESTQKARTVLMGPPKVVASTRIPSFA
jgi:hypothetical protein